MVAAPLAQVVNAGLPPAVQIGLGVSLCLLAAYFTVLAFASRSQSRGDVPPGSGESSLLAAAIFGAAGYHWLAGAFGWPGGAAGLKLIRQLLIECAVYAVLAALWLAVRRAAARATSQGSERIEPPSVESLANDEQLLWIGRPDPRVHRGRAWTMFAFSFLPLAACGGCALVVAMSVAAGRFQPALAAPALACLGFFWIGATAFFTPWRVRSRWSRVVYAVTPRRALIAGGVGWHAVESAPVLQRPVYSLAGQVVASRALKRRSRTQVDIVFGQERQGDGGAEGPRYVDVGFIGLRDWQEAESQLQRLFPREEEPTAPSFVLESSLAPTPAASLLVFWLFVALLCSPWLAIGVMATLAGLRAMLDPGFFPELRICLPAGLALLGMVAALAWYGAWHAPRTTIEWFRLEGRELAYRCKHGKKVVRRTDDVASVAVERNGRGHRFTGWRIKFQDGAAALLPPGIPRGADLAGTLQLQPGLLTIDG